MHLRDISLGKRLLWTNFTMMIVPVVILALIGMLVFWGIRATGNAKLSELSMLWPEKGQALSIQFAVSSIRVKLEHGPSSGMMEHPSAGEHHGRGMNGMMRPERLRELLEDCQVLEAQGVSTAIVHKGQLMYVSPGADARELLTDIRKRCGDDKSAYLWDEKGFYFQYASRNGNLIVMGRGNVPYQGETVPIDEAKHIVTGFFLSVLGAVILLIIFLGRYISKILSQQILEPLAELRVAAAAIQQGNFNTSLNVTGRDELGQTCAAFEQMRLELKKAKEMQEKYEQSRKELIADISHDLSTPLTSVKGYASGILDGIAKTPEKQQHYLEMIRQTAGNMEKMVESLSLFSKLDLGKMPFNFEQVNINAYLADYAEESKFMYAEQGLELHYVANKEGNSSAEIMLDRIQFQRVIENLLGNSLKYRKGEIVAVNISLENVGENICITFEDNGIGVAEEDLPRLFDRFYRTDTARTNVFKGSGLGLSIVKHIIQAMQGKIIAKKAEIGGLAVCITLPQAENFINNKENQG